MAKRYTARDSVEIKNNENRVAITPAGVLELVQRKHQVYIQSGAGVGSGFENCYIGYQSGFNATGGNYNTALGVYALRDGTTADRCTGIGRSSLISNTSGDFNTAIGMSSGE